MKTLLNFAFAILISAFSINANANTNAFLEGSPAGLETQVLSMLGDIDISISEDTKVSVNFYVNDYKEIVIVDIDSKSTKIQNFIKNRMDQEALYGSEFEINLIYSLQIEFVQNKKTSR